ncbi:aminotransferase class-III [Fusarium acutatum]|uniref:Aminotransferase class-III n=1 Tax=Fusarium acutatum TaxID=78861 RepID=A0A8H4NI61_9HYPO|nr:aminotransferase class-III [Fusarium acutatum]
MTSSTQAQHLLADLLNNYEKKNPKSKQSIQDAAKYIPGGTTRSVLAQHPFPLVIQSGQGATLLSVDGDTYLDFVSEYFMGIYGHSHPEILAAIAETAKSGLNYGAPNLGEAELAKLLVNRFPSVEHIRFCNSASEANIFAVAMMTEKRINELNALGNDVRGRLGALLQEWDPQGKRAFLTGFGSIIGLGWTAADSSTYQRLLYHFLLSKGIYMGSRGFFALNFAHEKSHTDVLIAAFKDFLSFLTDSSAKL